jgi:translation initiation factor IF-2
LIDLINLQKLRPAAFPHITPIDAVMSWTDIEDLKSELQAKAKLPMTPAPALQGEITVSDTTTVSELAAMLGQKPYKIITDLMQFGVFATVTQSLDLALISKIAHKYGFTVRKKP